MDEHSIQSLLPGPWWVPCNKYPVQRGQYLFAPLPHVDLVPYVLVADGRDASNPTDHSTAKGKL